MKWLTGLGCACLTSTVLLILTGFKTAPTEAVTPRDFPSDAFEQLPYDVDALRVHSLLAEMEASEKRGNKPAALADLMAAQREFDILTWQAFLALNTPVAADSNDPAIALKPGASLRPRWEFWVPSQAIFLPNGQDPRQAGKNADESWNEIVANNLEGGPSLVKSKAAWRQEASPQDNFQAFSGPLIDQNGKWVRYEAMVNHEEFNYIVDNELYSLDGQIALSQRASDNEVSFPENIGTSRHGAIEIKLAWKELFEPIDDAKRFYTQTVNVKIAGPPGPDGKPIFRPVKAGLVGMHISMRTASSPEWIWATFEQIDNVRSNPTAHGMSHINFFNPSRPDVPVNQLAPKNAEIGYTPSSGLQYTTWYESLTTIPTQVTRVKVPLQPGMNDYDQPIADEVAALNQQVQKLLKGKNSVFQYYELIGTQWPVRKNAPAFTGGQGSAPESIAHKTPGNMIPTFLVNTTMETYFQKGEQKAGPLEEDDRLTDNSLIDSTMVQGTESCVGCHYSAGIAIGYKKNPDGSYFLEDGERVPIFGDRNNSGKVGGGEFSWLLQLEASAPKPGLATASTVHRTRKPRIRANAQP